MAGSMHAAPLGISCAVACIHSWAENIWPLKHFESMFALRQTRFRVWEIQNLGQLASFFYSAQHPACCAHARAACMQRLVSPQMRKRGYEHSSPQNIKTNGMFAAGYTSQGLACHGVHRDTVNANGPSGTFSLGPPRSNGASSNEQKLLGRFEKLFLTVHNSLCQRVVGGSQLSLIYLPLNLWANLIACELKIRQNLRSFCRMHTAPESLQTLKQRFYSLCCVLLCVMRSPQHAMSLLHQSRDTFEQVVNACAACIQQDSLASTTCMQLPQSSGDQLHLASYALVASVQGWGVEESCDVI